MTDLVDYDFDTLSKCSGDYPIFNWGLKLNSRNSAEKYILKKTHRDQLIFHRGAK